MTGLWASGGAVMEELLTPGIWILEGYAPGFDRVEEDFTVEEGRPLSASLC